MSRMFIKPAVRRKVLPYSYDAAVTVPADTDQSRAGYVLTTRIKGYLISHAHLDHVAGLIIASPDDRW